MGSAVLSYTKNFEDMPVKSIFFLIWAADPKGMMSYKTEEEFSSILGGRGFVRGTGGPRAWGVTRGQEQGGLEPVEGIRGPGCFEGWGLEALGGWGHEAPEGWGLEGLEP